MEKPGSFRKYKSLCLMKLSSVTALLHVNVDFQMFFMGEFAAASDIRKILN